MKNIAFGMIIAFGICAWIISPFLLDILLAWKFLVLKKGVEVDLEARGQFGDSFGFVTSLFSFLSFVGVLAVFFLQKRHSDTKDKPFLMLSVSKDKLPLKISRQSADQEYQFGIAVGVNNYSEHLAHSCIFEFEIASDSHIHKFGSIRRYRPVIKKEDDEIVEQKFTSKVSTTSWFLDHLTSNKEVRFVVAMSYQNSNGVSYASRNNFLLSLDAGDLAAINELRAGEFTEGAWGGGKFVILNIKEDDPFVT